MSLPSPVGNVMITAARAAGRSLARDFNEIEQLQVYDRVHEDFVAKASLRAEQIIQNQLSQGRPGYGFEMKDQGTIEGTDKTNRFIVDALSGSLNFLHGHPHFAVSIALEREGNLLTGVVYDVARNELIWAERDRGAWIDRRKLSVSGRKELKVACLATVVARKGATEPLSKAHWNELACIIPACGAVRQSGSVSLDLAYVASGRLDGFWGRDLNFCDVAAGLVLCMEASGTVTETVKHTFPNHRGIVAGSVDIMAQLEARIAKARSI